MQRRKSGGGNYETDDLPDFEDYSMKGRTFRFFNGEASYPFGFGLAYTEYNYDNLFIDNTLYDDNEIISLSFNITNVGERDGEDVVQIYISEVDPGTGSPIRSLVDFKRIPVAQGSSKNAKIQLPVSRFAGWDTESKAYLTNSGKYLLQVGASSDDIRLQKEISVK
jgi:beta-glucosidase